MKPVPKPLISLVSSEICTGCGACAQACPNGSIKMVEDKEGFLQPVIDAQGCVACHKCEHICPITNRPTSNSSEIHAYAVKNNNNEVRLQSSSGGAFYSLAKRIIEQGGVVFGARFNDDWGVVHDYAETLEGILPFMRSKYVQSSTESTFKTVKQFLECGRIVLYSGTPCQLGGLKSFLGKDYDNLISVDFICHGTPSPMVWREYLKSLGCKDEIAGVNFRDKQNGWKDFCQTIYTRSSTLSEAHSDNIYFLGFNYNVFLRRSCYDCYFKTVSRNVDITLADYWGGEHLCPELFDEKGISLVLTHTVKGDTAVKALADCSIVEQRDFMEALSSNPSVSESAKSPNHRRNDFFRSLRKSGFKKASIHIVQDRISIRVIRKIKKILGWIR